jgi:hypothetical protein
MCCPTHKRDPLTPAEIERLYEERRMREAWLTAQFQAKYQGLFEATFPPGTTATVVGPYWQKFLASLNEPPTMVITGTLPVAPREVARKIVLK